MEVGSITNPDAYSRLISITFQITTACEVHIHTRPAWGAGIAWSVLSDAIDLSLLQNIHIGHTQPPIQWVAGLFLCRESSRGVRLATNFRPAPRLRMRGAKPTLPLYALMACTGTTSPLPNGDWKNVVPYWQVLHSHGYRQDKWTYKEDSQGADTKSGIWLITDSNSDESYSDTVNVVGQWGHEEAETELL